MAGNHGDEYPGQVAILKLMRDAAAGTGARPADPDSGAEHAGRARRRRGCRRWTARTSTAASPASPTAPSPSMIAHYLTPCCFRWPTSSSTSTPAAAALDFYPCAHMHLVPDREQRRQMVEGTLAWNTDFAFLYTDIAGTGLLPVEAERQGKIVITTEMGGGETVSAARASPDAGRPAQRAGAFRRARRARSDTRQTGSAADALGAGPRPRGLPLRPGVGNLREPGAAGRAT